MFRGEGGNPSLQEAAIEIRMVGDYKDDPAEQIVDGFVVDAVTGDCGFRGKSPANPR
jgi:hypothetical protein